MCGWKHPAAYHCLLHGTNIVEQNNFYLKLKLTVVGMNSISFISFYIQASLQAFMVCILEVQQLWGTMEIRLWVRAVCICRDSHCSLVTEAWSTTTGIPPLTKILSSHSSCGWKNKYLFNFVFSSSRLGSRKDWKLSECEVNTHGLDSEEKGKTSEAF